MSRSFVWTNPPKIGAKLRCIKGHTNSKILTEGKVYTVGVLIVDGVDHTGKCEGVLVWHGDIYNMSPYVWDLSRFEPAYD